MKSIVFIENNAFFYFYLGIMIIADSVANIPSNVKLLDSIMSLIGIPFLVVQR